MTRIHKYINLGTEEKKLMETNPEIFYICIYICVRVYILHIPVYK